MEAKSAGMLLGMFLTFNKVHETQIWLFFFFLYAYLSLMTGMANAILEQ